VTERKPSPPVNTAAGGLRLWESIVDGYDLDEHELSLLREAVRLVDRCDALAAIVERDGVMAPGPGLTMRAHPALTEARQQQIALARVFASLRLPSGDESTGRPQRRVGVRGPYNAGTGTGGGPARLRRVQ
jgi:hypothetical protein